MKSVSCGRLRSINIKNIAETILRVIKRSSFFIIRKTSKTQSYCQLEHIKRIVSAGYAYSQGLSEDLIGILLACAASTGIVATFLYPRIRRAIGLHRTGLYALGTEVTFLTLCVASVFCPGSPFDPGYYARARPPEVNPEILFENSTNDFLYLYTNLNNTTVHSVSNFTSTEQTTIAQTPSSYISIAFLMAGIIGARVGKSVIKGISLIELCLRPLPNYLTKKCRMKNETKSLLTYTSARFNQD